MPYRACGQMSIRKTEATFAGGVLPVSFVDGCEYIDPLFLFDFCFIKFVLTIQYVCGTFLIFGMV